MLLAARRSTRRSGTSCPAFLVGGIGMALTMTPSAAAATRSVPVDKAGVGSAVLNSARQVGGSIGIAIMGAIVAAEAGGERTPEAFMRGFETRAPRRGGDRRRRRRRRVHARAPARGARGPTHRSRTAAEALSDRLTRPKGDSSPVGRRGVTACRGAGRGDRPHEHENAPGCGSGGVSPFEATPSRGGEPENRGSAAQPRSSCARLRIRRWCPRIRSGVRSAAVWA